jgi:hypothetical protein
VHFLRGREWHLNAHFVRGAQGQADSRLDIDENIIMVYDNEGVFNTNILVDHFISRILKPHFLKWQITKSLVILDHDRNHITHIFKNTMESLGAELVFIPPDLTSEL